MSGLDFAPFSCSFCGRTQDQARHLISGPASFICDECVDLAAEIMAERRRAIPAAEREAAPLLIAAAEERDRLRADLAAWADELEKSPTGKFIAGEVRRRFASPEEKP